MEKLPKEVDVAPLAHCCIPVAEGFRVFDIWADEATFKRFATSPEFSATSERCRPETPQRYLRAAVASLRTG